MKSIRSLPLPLLASLVLALSAASASAADAARVIVKFKTSTNAQAMSAASSTQAATHHAQALSQRTGLALTDGRVINSRLQVVRAAGLSSAQLASRLAKETDVEYAVVDERRHAAAAPNDPRYAAGQSVSTPAVGQWYLRAPTSTVLSAINAEGAWTQATGAGVVVAVLDTGVRFEHPDLAMKLYPGYDFVSDATISNDGDARDSDAADPGDWITSADVSAGGDFADCTAEDSSWHGTQTAGLIGAAANNGIGMAGVGGDVMILPLRVLGKCGGFDSDIMAAMLWAVGQHVSGIPDNTDHKAKVLNLSLGSAPSSSGCPQSYVDTIKAVNDAGAVVVASAGNDGLAVNMPAACAGAIAVAGVRHAGTKVGYSSLGPQVAISAPAGNCVVTSGPCQYALLTTTNSGTTGPASSTYSDATNPSLGTSFSAPMVAGTAALMFSAKPSLTPAEVLSKLKSSARVFPSVSSTGVASCQAPTSTEQDECACTTTTCGAGFLDASAAVAAVATAGQVIPVISFDTSTATVGGSFTLDSSRSVLPSGRSVLAYDWSIVSGGTNATVTSAANAATATLSGSAQGTVVVRLSLTDDLNSVTTRDVSIAVGGASSSGGGGTTPTTPTTTLPQGQSSGGGALGLHWLLGLTLAIVVLAERNRRLRLQKI